MSAADLTEIMEFDHVIAIADGGAIASQLPGIYAPSCEHDDDDDVLIDGTPWKDSAWSLMTGWTGQYSYSGPVMHASEQISDSMAEWMLERPGVYVAVVIEAPCGYDGSTLCTEDAGCDCEPAGWSIAYRDAA